MKHVVLFSGGLDSLVTLAICRDQNPAKSISLYFCDTGSRVARSEYFSTLAIAKHYGVSLQVGSCEMPLAQKHLLWMKSGFMYYIDGRLTDRSLKTRNFVLPYRNVMLLGQASMCAGLLRAGRLWVGFDYEHAGGSSRDKSPEFVAAWDAAIAESSEPDCGIKLVTPLQNCAKHEIIRKGLRLRAPYQLSFSCYNGKHGVGCGLCASCVDRLRGFAKCELLDPAPYSWDIAERLFTQREFRSMRSLAWGRKSRYPVFTNNKHVGWQNA